MPDWKVERGSVAFYYSTCIHHSGIFRVWQGRSLSRVVIVGAKKRAMVAASAGFMARGRARGALDAYENSWAPEVKGSWYPYSENGVVNIKRAPLCVATSTLAHAYTTGRLCGYATYAFRRTLQNSQGKPCACSERYTLAFEVHTFPDDCIAPWHATTDDHLARYHFRAVSFEKGVTRGVTREGERGPADYFEIVGRYDAIRVLILSHGACTSHGR